jgi:hypothetical protein
MKKLAKRFWNKKAMKLRKSGLDKLLYLAVPGVSLSVRAGRLIVNDEKTYSPSTHSLRCIILANAGFITTDAVAWLAREHVALFIACLSGCLTCAA